MVAENLDFTMFNYEDDFQILAERLANDYFNEQSSRLANFIVRIKPLPITD